MQKTILIGFFLGFFSLHSVQAQPALSGVYQKLTLGLDPASGVVTGFYEQILDAPNMSHQECSFYLVGNKAGDKYAVQVWSPGDKNSKATAGELALFAADNNKPSVLLKLEKLDRDCTALNPDLGKGQGALLDQSKSGAWTEVRVVENSKASYYQSPDPAAPARGGAKRGSVLTVSQRKSDWMQMKADQKPKGWIRETDLYPMKPGVESAAPALAEKPSSATAKASAPPAAPEQPPAGAAAPVPQAAPAPALESKGTLLHDLKTLSAQAFELALQVLQAPAQRTALAGRRAELEKQLNDLLSRLNAVDRSAYREAAAEAIPTFLDLQYVQQAQPVVSLRLHQKIQASGK